MQRGVAGCAQVPFLRVFRSAFRVDARRWLRWILNPPRRSFKLRVLVDRQRPMKNVTLDRNTTRLHSTHQTITYPDFSLKKNILRNNVPIDLFAIVSQEILGPKLR